MLEGLWVIAIRCFFGIAGSFLSETELSQWGLKKIIICNIPMQQYITYLAMRERNLARGKVLPGESILANEQIGCPVGWENAESGSADLCRT